MRLAIRHATRYRFGEPVQHGLQRLRLTPKETQGQRILDWSMEYEGAREELCYDDQHHNHVTLVSVLAGAQDVVITCRGTVETEDRAGVIGHHAGHTQVDTCAEDAVAAGHGVCQDHAQIFIAAARTLEIPARYVSG